ncbi:hypothetical protein QZH41_007877 [Actinostola sp. cb2023]|nr:hypothetical protein QZH41_007877 [Actinostola sp. cb2023]
MCIACYRARRQRQRQQPANMQAVESSEPISQLASLQVTGPTTGRRRRRHRRRTPTTNSTIKRPSSTRLEHHIFSKGEWRRARLNDQPRVSITISINKPEDSRDSSHNQPSSDQTQISAIADTGTQSDLWSLEEFLACGFSRDELHPVSLSLSAANRSPIAIEGAFFAQLTTTHHCGKVVSTRSMVYVSSSVRAMYLSYESLLNLGLLSKDFPSKDSSEDPSDSRNASRTPSHVNAMGPINDECKVPYTSHDAPCSCPQRTGPPPRPAELPFPCTPENNDRMKAWLLKRYASSTFNTCPHQALPCMEGPPVEIHVEPDATPKACHTPATVPLHWQQKVHDDLLRDEDLGVIERVPYGEPVTWCHRMVITRKHDGSPRRTVDLSPLNKFCRRETFATESPFHLARRIPQNTWKTVTDAWNGYHSVPLRESDRHLTTFITPFGRWRYMRAPQGFLSSGDG